MAYGLKAVCGLLGVPADTLRKWESRYALVSPAREPNGYRTYEEDDLRRLRTFVEQRRLGRSGAEAARLARSQTPKPRKAPAAFPRRALAALERFDRTAVTDLFEDTLRKGRPGEVFSAYWLPVMREIGEKAHAQGGLWIAVEHFATALLRERLLGALARSSRAAGPRLVLAAPSGERHELGLLLAAAELEAKGLRCTYLGIDLPLESLCAALERLRPDGLTLALRLDRPRRDMKLWLSTLRGRFPRLPLFFAGQATLRHANLLRDHGARFLGDDLDAGTARIARELGVR